jgi:hypothetical protein
MSGTGLEHYLATGYEQVSIINENTVIIAKKEDDNHLHFIEFREGEYSEDWFLTRVELDYANKKFGIEET